MRIEYKKIDNELIEKIAVDFDNDGIPEILILYAAETWGGHVLYKFVDGEYRDAGGMSWPWFYTDEQGRIVMVEGDHGSTKISYVNFLKLFSVPAFQLLYIR